MPNIEFLTEELRKTQKESDIPASFLRLTPEERAEVVDFYKVELSSVKSGEYPKNVVRRKVERGGVNYSTDMRFEILDLLALAPEKRSEVLKEGIYCFTRGGSPFDPLRISLFDEINPTSRISVLFDGMSSEQVKSVLLSSSELPSNRKAWLTDEKALAWVVSKLDCEHLEEVAKEYGTNMVESSGALSSLGRDDRAKFKKHVWPSVEEAIESQQVYRQAVQSLATWDKALKNPVLPSDPSGSPATPTVSRSIEPPS